MIVVVFQKYIQLWEGRHLLHQVAQAIRYVSYYIMNFIRLYLLIE